MKFLPIIIAIITIIFGLWHQAVVCQETPSLSSEQLKLCAKYLAPGNICKGQTIAALSGAYCICGTSSNKACGNEFDSLHTDFAKQCSDNVVNDVLSLGATSAFKCFLRTYGTLYKCPELLQKFPKYAICDEKKKIVDAACDKCDKCRYK